MKVVTDLKNLITTFSSLKCQFICDTGFIIEAGQSQGVILVAVVEVVVVARDNLFSCFFWWLVKKRNYLTSCVYLGQGTKVPHETE